MAALDIPTPRWALPLLKPAPYKAAYGGRGSGKSHQFAGMLVEEHIANPELRSAGIREVQKSLDMSVKQLLVDKINEYGASHLFDVQTRCIKRINGNRPCDGIMIFQGMQDHNATNIKSLEGFDRFWCEEAQGMSQHSLDVLRPTLRKDTAELWFTWNPLHETDPVDKLLRGPNPPPGSVVINVNYFDNPWLPQKLRDEMEYDKRRDPEKYAHVWLGEYQRNSEARVFKNWTIEEFEAPADAVHRFGADWGFATDPTTLIRCHIIGRKLYVDYEAYRVGCEIEDTPELFLSVPGAERWNIVADSARPETISYMRRHGFPKIIAAVKGAKSLEEGVEWLKNYDIVVHPRCKHLIDELTLYSYKVDEKTQMVLPILADKDNHLIDALRYACEAVRRTESNQRPVYVPPVPVRHNWNAVRR